MAAAYTPMLLPGPLAAKLRAEGWQIAITGATGWMGQALLEMLEPVFDEEYAARVIAFGSTARDLTLRSGRVIALRAITELPELPAAKWMLIHAAYGTRDRVSVQGNDAFIAANAALTDIVTEAMQRVRPMAMLFPSSGAVYAADGSIETDLARNPYGVLKHRDEQHFTNVAATTGTRLVIPRVFNMSGAYINKWSAYALSDLIVQVLRGTPLHIASAGAVLRSYMHVGDILALSLSAMLDSAADACLFDTRGETDVELAALAQQIETIMLGAPRSSVRTADAALPANRYLGKPEPMQQLCHRYGITPLPVPEQIALTVDYIRATFTA